MPSLIVDLQIDADEYLKYYKIPRAVVNARSRCGRSVQFPANILQSHVLHGGVQGSFSIEFDDLGKFKRITRLE